MHYVSCCAKKSILTECDKMTKDKARQWDGKSRPTNDVYKQRWQEIFGKKKPVKKLSKEDQKYLDSLKNKL